MAIPFALSISHFVSSVGADAGFAAIIGLAILVLLYFAQARETASLREHAAEAAQRVEQLELRLSQVARAAAAPTAPSGAAPAPASANAHKGAAAPALAASAPVRSRTASGVPVAVPAFAAAVPAAPAGVGAPALSAATRLIPSGAEESIAIHATGAQAASALTPAAARSGVASAEGFGAGGAVVAAPAPATAAGGGNGVNRATPPLPVPARARDSLPPPRAPSRPAGARPAPPPPRRAAAKPAGRSGDRRRWLLVVAGLVSVAAVVVALLLVTSGGGSVSSSSSPAISNAPSAVRHRAGTRGALAPSAVTVAVLNGTSTANLAHSVSQRLSAAGYQPGPTGNATDQTLTATVVGYLPGQRRAAAIVARSLKLGSASIQPVGPSSQAVACPPSSACKVQVVVTVGSDLNSAASPASSSTT